MAKRPVYEVSENERDLVTKHVIEFEWHPGMSVSQKQKSIRSLHKAAEDRLGYKNILEISSKSELPIGRNLSAFSLSFDLGSGIRSSVECAFQGSKVFTNGGPYTDLYGLDSRAAKKDQRIKESGSLIRFSMHSEDWPLEPQTCFYDWIYINALYREPSLSGDVMDYQAFTDIEFNPAKSISCQAYSAALYVSLKRQDLLDKILKDRDMFIGLYENVSKKAVQPLLI